MRGLQVPLRERDGALGSVGAGRWQMDWLWPILGSRGGVKRRALAQTLDSRVREHLTRPPMRKKKTGKVRDEKIAAGTEETGRVNEQGCLQVERRRPRSNVQGYWEAKSSYWSRYPHKFFTVWGLLLARQHSKWEGLFLKSQGGNLFFVNKLIETQFKSFIIFTKSNSIITNPPFKANIDHWVWPIWAKSPSEDFWHEFHPQITTLIVNSSGRL